MGNMCIGPKLGASGFLQSVTAALWRTRQPEDSLPSYNAESNSKNPTKETPNPSKPSDSQKPRDNSSDSSKPKDNSSDSSKPKDNSIDSSKPKDNSIDSSKPKDNSIDSSKPNDTSIDSSKPNDTSIDSSKPKDNSTDSSKPKDNSTDSSRPKDNSTDSSKPKDSIDSSKPIEGPRTVVAPTPTQTTPPETVKISHDQHKPSKPVNPVKPEVKNEEPKPAADDKPKKPTHARRQSLGLQLDSVLGRKTGNIKEMFTIGRKLGQGQFGTTFLCLEKGTNKEYACKTIAKRKLTSQDDVDDVRREIQIMHHLAGHPNVIQIIDAYEDAVAVHVIMELCAGGELFDRIIQRGHYTEKKAAELARVIVGVVEACHSLGVMHRDLKPENFLFVNQEEDAPLKTIDFGLSIFFRPGEKFTDVVGSPYYVAPEVLRKHYGPECDVWSAGVIIYILLSGVPPFWDETEQGIFEQVLRGELDFVSEPWPNISEQAKDLVRRMLVRDPKKRMTAHEVLCHQWVRIDGVAPDKPLDSAVLSRLKQFSAMNKFKKIAVRVIAENLSEEEIAGLKEMFKMIDADDSGQITLEELKNGLERVGTHLKESEIVALMKAADVDNSGTIDYGEFLAAMLHLNKIQKEDHLFAAFSYFDKDGSGYITRDELQQVCQQFGLEEDHLDEIISEADKDNDGRIDYNEFVAMMQDTGFNQRLS